MTDSSNDNEGRHTTHHHRMNDKGVWKALVLGLLCVDPLYGFSVGCSRPSLLQEPPSSLPSPASSCSSFCGRFHRQDYTAFSRRQTLCFLKTDGETNGMFETMDTEYEARQRMEFGCSEQNQDRQQASDAGTKDKPITVQSMKEYVRDLLKKLAALSLKDYQWRSALFKSNEADRMMEESLARLRGEDAAYVRPMDAGDERMGPLVSHNMTMKRCWCFVSDEHVVFYHRRACSFPFIFSSPFCL